MRRAEQAQLSQQAQHPQRTQLLQVQLEKAVQARLHAIEECNASKERARVELELLREKYRVEIKAPNFPPVRPPSNRRIFVVISPTWSQPRVYAYHRGNFRSVSKAHPVKAKPKGPSIFSTKRHYTTSSTLQKTSIGIEGASLEDALPISSTWKARVELTNPTRNTSLSRERMLSHTWLLWDRDRNFSQISASLKSKAAIRGRSGAIQGRI